VQKFVVKYEDTLHMEKNLKLSVLAVVRLGNLWLQNISNHINAIFLITKVLSFNLCRYYA